MRVLARSWPFLVVLAVLAGPPPAQAQPTDCSTFGQNHYARTVLREYYYWYKELPDPDPGQFASPEAYLEAVRFRPLDEGFSYISPEAASDAFFSDSQYVGFGFRTHLVAPGDLRIAEAFPDSPATAAGMERGQQVLEVDGQSIADLDAAGRLDGAFGPTTIGHTVRVRMRNGDGAEREVSITKALVTIPTVAATRTFEVGGRRIGYVLFHNFVQPSNAALDVAFAQLVRDGAQDVVLDLRYNGGGLVSVAQHLADLIGGLQTNGKLMAKYVHNDRQSTRNTSLFFGEAAGALGAPRLVAITTRASASASELIINALKPYIPVAVVGDNTYGKPVGQYGFRFCGKILYPVAFSIRNASDEGDYFGGFAPDCPAPDDLGFLLGDPREGSLAEALHYAVNGTCSAGARAGVAAQRSRRPLEQPYARNGFRRMIGAY